MTAVPGAVDGPVPMEIEEVKNKDCTVHRLLVRGGTVKDCFKAHRYIEALCLALQLGEVKISERKDLGALQVEFTCSEAAQCVKNITFEIEGDKYCPASHTAVRPQDVQPNTGGESLVPPTQELHSTVMSASPDQGAWGRSNATETVYQEHQHIGRRETSPSTFYGQDVNGQPHSPGFGNKSSPSKLPLLMAVQVDLEALNPALHGEVLNLIRMNNRNPGIPIHGKVTFNGLFEDVARFYQAVNDLHNNIPGKQNPNQMVNAAEVTHAAEIQSRDREQSIAEEQAANQLRLSLFHYDYLNKVWDEQISTIQQRYNMDLLTEVVLKLQPKEQQGQSKVKEALEALTKSIQPLITDLGRVKVMIPESDRPNVPRAIRDVQTKNPLCLLSELEDGFAITGPRSHLEQVKDELMERLKSTSRHRATLRIENEMTAVMTELEMPKCHWDLLDNIFKDELKSICIKYQVQIKPDVHSIKEGVRILVKNQGANQDLSANALQAFIRLYQKAVTSCITRTVDSNHTDRVKLMFDEMRSNRPSVRLIHADGGGLCLFGLPHYVELAVRDIEQCLGKKVFVRSVNGVQGGTSQSGTSVSSQRNAEGASGGEEEENTCCICLCPFKDKMTTECKHSFCKGCWKQAIAVTPQCPICKKNYGKVIGDQPYGTMIVHHSAMSLPGFEWCGMIGIDYNFPNGIQSEKHPYPGSPYWGTNRKAYLPDNPEGREVLRLLGKAFDQKLIFTIGVSRTTGMKDVVTWNDIHHKTSTHGGPTQFGYPDPDYLKRVREELRAKGIE